MKTINQSSDIDTVFVGNASIKPNAQFVSEKSSSSEGKSCDSVFYYRNILANDFEFFQGFLAVKGMISLSITEGTPERPSNVSELYYRIQRNTTSEVIKEGFISIEEQESIEFPLTPDEQTDVYFKGIPNTKLQITDQLHNLNIDFDGFVGRAPTKLGEFTASLDTRVKLSLSETRWERIFVDIHEGESPRPITSKWLSLSYPTAEVDLPARQIYVFKIYNPIATDFTIRYCHTI